MAASGTPGARIEVSGLRKRFGPVTAVDRLSFTVEPGSVTGFLGPHGAGKTTTLRILLGLVTPDAGVATIGGRAYADLARSGRNHLRVYCTVNGYPLSRADEVLERPRRRETLGQLQGGLVPAGYAAVLAAAGTSLVVRRDVT